MNTNRTSYRNNNKKNTRVTRNYSSPKTSPNRSYYSKQNTLKSGYTRASRGNVAAKEYGYYSSNFSSYNTSSVAEDYYYDTEIPVKTQHKPRVKHAREKEILQLNMPKTIFSIAVVFSLSLTLLCAYAVNSNSRLEKASKQAELAKITEENQYLKTTLEDNIDLSKIAKEAEKLGLQKPQAYQITEVQVPNESYTVQYDAKIATQDKSVWEFLKGLLSKN